MLKLHIQRCQTQTCQTYTRWFGIVGVFALLATLSFCQGCASQFPVGNDQVMRITPADPSPRPEGDPEILQITWHGTASYEIKLGDLSVLLDPFVSHQGLVRSVFGGTIQTDTERVEATFGGLEKPQGIFVAHAHWDHLMDVHAILGRKDWSDIPVFGSPTARNILLGYPSITEESLDFRVAKTCGSWQKVIETPTGKVEYQAFASGHAPHFLGVRLYDGIVENPRNKAPRKAHHFKIGQVYAFALRLTQGSTTFTVYFQSSASPWKKDSLPKDLKTVDVAILCVAGWNKVEGYPEGLIQHLKPAHILLGHFNNFFQERTLNDPERPEVVPSARLQGFLNEIQKSVEGTPWRQILVPDVETTLRFEK